MRQDEYYTVREVALILKDKKANIEQMIKNKTLAAEREGREWWIPAHVVHKHLIPYYYEPTDSEEATELQEVLDKVRELEAQGSKLEEERGVLQGRLDQVRAQIEMGERTEANTRAERDRLLRQLKEERGERRWLQQELEKARKPWWRRLS